MTTLCEIFNKIDDGRPLEKVDLKHLLELENSEDTKKLFEKAYSIKKRYVGCKVYFRGIIEFSNICEKDCFYCGIRKSNTKNQRFQMTEEEISAAAHWAFKNNYGSVVLQSGERSDPYFATFIENVLQRIKRDTGGKLGITLSLGEQTEETYSRWFNAGAHRYLLRIETSSPELYRKLHPAGHEWEKRADCLRLLKKIGYQTGTGVMIGLPWQTIDNLVDDMFFFRDIDADMIGMGPYIPHGETPTAGEIGEFNEEKQLTLSLKMIAATRLFLRDVNIASTTALQSLKPDGRELGLLAGANIIMPNVTETKYRPLYQLYKNKPCLDENSSMCRGCLQKRVESIGETIGFDEWGDSPHFRKRTTGSQI